MSDHTSKKVTRRGALAASVAAAGGALVGANTAAASAPRAGKLKGKRVLVAIGEFSEGMETYYIVFRMMEEGIVPVVAAREVKMLQMVVHDFDPQYSNYTEKLGYTIQVEVAYKDVDPADFDGLIIPGGRGPEEIRQDEDAKRIVGYFYDKKLPLGAMCHGPQLIYAARSVKGRRMAAYSGIRADIELAGAEFVDEPAIIDGAMVTSRGWPDLPYMMPKFLQVLAGS